jgi:hypothetical protein
MIHEEELHSDQSVGASKIRNEEETRSDQSVCVKVE